MAQQLTEEQEIIALVVNAGITKTLLHFWKDVLSMEIDLFPKYPKLWKNIQNKVRQGKKEFMVSEIIQGTNLKVSELVGWIGQVLPQTSEISYVLEDYRKRHLAILIKKNTAKQLSKIKSLDQLYSLFKIQAERTQPKQLINYQLFKNEEILTETQQQLEGNAGKIVGNTGVKYFDQLIGGIRTGMVYAFVGASGVGKSMVSIQILDEAIKAGTKVAYISSEMSGFQIGVRLLDRKLKFGNWKIQTNNLTDNELYKLHEEEGKLADELTKVEAVIASNVHYLDDVEMIINTNDIDLVIIDHLHNFRFDGTIYEKVSSIAHRLQELTIKHGIATVVFAQMSKEDLNRGDYETVSAKGAMDLNEVADVFVVLERERIGENDKKNELKLVVSKNRHGDTGLVRTNVEFPGMVISNLLNQ